MPQEVDIRSFIYVTRVPPANAAGDHASPFNLRFRAQPLTQDLRSVIAGSCIYLVAINRLVAYIGKYQPSNGRIIDDRFGRHLQTITGRGADIGFGGQGNPNRRLQTLLHAVSDERLRAALIHEAEGGARRFRDTGYNTTPNRLRFASENWERFGAEDDAILDQLEFTLVRLVPNPDQMVCKQQISRVEERLLGQFRPPCNAQYRHERDGDDRLCITVERVIHATREHMVAVTGDDARDCITLCA